MRRNIGRDIQDDQFLDHSLRDENIARSGSGSLKTGSVCLDIQAYPGLASNLLPGRTQGFFYCSRAIEKLIDHSNRCIFPRADKSFLFFVLVAGREKAHFGTLSYEPTRFLAALLSANTPYRAPVRLLAAGVHAGFQGHGRCGRYLCGEPCSVRSQDHQLRQPLSPSLIGG
jgi:hypothetical protein